MNPNLTNWGYCPDSQIRVYPKMTEKGVSIMPVTIEEAGL